MAGRLVSGAGAGSELRSEGDPGEGKKRGRARAFFVGDHRALVGRGEAERLLDVGDGEGGQVAGHDRQVARWLNGAGGGDPLPNRGVEGVGGLRPAPGSDIRFARGR